jgi:hypothetical protein
MGQALSYVRNGFSALALFAAMAACTTPVAAPAGETDTSNLVSADGEDVICRRLVVTGTRFAEKTCKTQAAWDAFDDYTNSNAKEQTDKFQRLNSGCSTQAEGSCS